MSRAIVIFARSPRAEAAAKRLPRSAERLFGAVAAGWAQAARGCGAQILVACASAHRSDFARLGFRQWIDQEGEDFGARLRSSVNAAFARGFETTLVSGIDAPPPSPRALEAVFLSVERGEARAVIAPSSDGGVNFVLLRPADAAFLGTIGIGERHLPGRCRDFFGDRLTVLTTVSDIDSDTSFVQAHGEAAWRQYRPLLSLRRAAARERVFFRAPGACVSSSLRAPPTVV